MTEKEKIALLEEMMDIDKGTLNRNTLLSDLEEWDSLSVISFIVLINDRFHKAIKGSEIQKFKTVGDAIAEMDE